MSDDTPEGARAALLAMIERLPDEAVARLLAVVWWWVRGPDGRGIPGASGGNPGAGGWPHERRRA